MRFSLPTDASLPERLRAFERYLNERYAETEAAFLKARDFESRIRLKTEKATIEVIRANFQQTFEATLSSP